MSKKKKSKQSNQKKQKELEKRRRKNRQREQEKNQLVLPVRRLTREELENWKERLQPAIDEANDRIRSLFRDGLTTTYLESISGGSDFFRFEIDDIMDANELRAYMTQVRVFMNDLGPTNDRAYLQTALLDSQLYKGQFGGQYEGRHFNTERIIDENGNLKREAIDPEIARRAFANYRRLEETWAAVIGRQDREGVYGSENLIIALYSVEARGIDSLDFGQDLLEAFSNETLRQWEEVDIQMSKAEAIITNWDEFYKRRNF